MKRKKSSQSVKQSHLLFVLSSPFEDAGKYGTEAARRDKDIYHTKFLKTFGQQEAKVQYAQLHFILLVAQRLNNCIIIILSNKICSNLV